MRNAALRTALASTLQYQLAAEDVLSAVQAIHRIRDRALLSTEARLHYVRAIRKNLAAAEDLLAGLDAELPPCVGERLADAATRYQPTQETDQ